MLSKEADVIAILFVVDGKTTKSVAILFWLMLLAWWKMLNPPMVYVSLADVIANVADVIATGQHSF